jgi:hypothetical protein
MLEGFSSTSAVFGESGPSPTFFFSESGEKSPVGAELSGWNGRSSRGTKNEQKRVYR